MSEIAKSRKPDRKFYRHPKYGQYADVSNRRAECQHKSSDELRTTNSIKAVDETNYSGQSLGDSPRDTRYAPGTIMEHSTAHEDKRYQASRRKDERYHRNLTWNPSGGSRHSETKPHRNRFQAARVIGGAPTLVDDIKTANPLDAKASCSEEDACRTSGPKYSEPTSAKTDTAKHGGLIHLPKDIDIYQSSDEPKTGISRQPKRGNQGSTTKPVVIVRPSFSKVQRYSESETLGSTLAAEQHGDTKGIGHDGVGFPQSLRATSASVSALPHTWTDTAKAAYQYYMQALSQMDQERQHPFDDANSLSNVGTVNSKQESQRSATSINFAMPVQAPNEKISAVIQQIVQLDAALTALLIPPGICARALPCVEPPPPHPQPGKQWTESQLLILRWWSTVERLRERLFALFESVILFDLDFCNTAHVEQGMWKSVFYTALELMRSWISHPESTNLVRTDRKVEDEQSVEEREQITSLLQHICLSDVIASGETRLSNLLDRIQTIHRVRLAPLLADGRPPPETRSRTRRLVYLSAQKLMLFLGDLARYKELLNGERNFGKARSWYQKAQLLIPKNGRSYNQLAVLAVYTSRHLDAMYYYMRTLAASNPFATASQSLSALFNEIRPRAENLIRQLRKPKNEPNAPHHGPFGNPNNRFQRAEIWVHPMDGQTTVLQGARRLVYLPPPINAGIQKISAKPGEVDLDTNCDNEDDDDEDAQAELEEYANMSLIELSRQFGLTFIHAHGKLYTKIGMETFPEVASLALQAFSGLLAQKPCPLSAERLCQLCIVNMYNVDRAVSLTNASNLSTIKRTESDSKTPKIQPISHLAGVETLRSVHHDHAARFALDFFSLLCRRTAQLLQEPIPQDAPAWWLPPDARLLLSALRLWSEWMILHPEHWLPPPNHRDPTLRPCLNDWQLIASLCTQAANWMNRNPLRPRYEELTPTTSMVLQSKDRVEGQDLEEDTSAEAHTCLGGNFENAFLFEEAVCAGFKPMLDLVPKMYTYSGHWTAETVADFVRVEKIVLFGDFLCGIDSPVLSYDVDRGVYEAVIEREMSERKEDKQTDPSISDERRVSESESAGFGDEKPSVPYEPVEETEHEASGDIVALQRQRALLQRQLEEESRLAAWRRNAIRQAASGGRRAVELEVHPIYLLPDTNCYIDWLEGIATLAQRSSNYTVLVPIVVVNELDTLARYGSSSNSWRTADDEEGDVTRAGLIQERARAAITYLEHEFAHRNTRLRALTARGSFMETIAFRNEINGGRAPGQVNDDVILACCNHFCKEDPERFSSRRGNDQGLVGESNNQPMRIHREIVLLTSDRNLRLKALNINVPVRPLRTLASSIMDTDEGLPSSTTAPTDKVDESPVQTALAAPLNASSSAQTTWDADNNVEVIMGPVDEYFKYDVKAHQSIVNAKPWEKDPHYFKWLKLSAVALLKMLIHARSGGNLEVMGVLIGKVAHQTMIVVDSTPLPVEGTETRVNAQAEAYEYMTTYKEVVARVGRTENVLGWYHSHPGYGCWLSGIDVTTQLMNQTYQEPFVAIVIDPIRTISSGKVNLGAFRTYPVGYRPPDEGPSEYQSIPMDKIEDFGVHCKQYYPLEVSHFKSVLDKRLLDLLWNKYWVNTLSSVSILAQPDYLAGLTKDLAEKVEHTVASVSRMNWDNDRLEDRLAKCGKDATKLATEQLHALMGQLIKDSIFNKL
ncbi:Mov34/MPN/PAD-1 family protein [Opisthorchis viverrini]|uniref:COP9 signalosome complex subunit 5 n=1 Tax=Opisthorchis viverrini TaxID=6198 RepID=A0A1S8X4H5_OPIVI|nr:Mov34/MPN/PAD-1 family protein [Opisthorchis viverrini]